MFKLAILIGLYSYSIFLLGLLHLLKKEIIFIVTLVFFLLFIKNFLKKILTLLSSIKRVKSINVFSVILILLIIFQALINLIGALGPELAFDALWYHLTIPKIYLEQNSIFYIGGMLYYSAMPKFTEMIYLASLALGSEIVAKLIHFAFGIGTLIVLYKMSRRFLPTRDSLLVGLIFYSNLVVGWLSTTAYIDLARTFFEAIAMWGFLIYINSNSHSRKWLMLSATVLGFAASCKLLSLWSLMIYLVLFLYLYFSKRLSFKILIKHSILFCVVVFFIISPWLLFSYINTGNPFYPLFSPIHKNLDETVSFTFLDIVKTAWSTFLRSPDPISPVYFIFLPLLIFRSTNQKTKLLINILTLYLFIGFIVLYFTPPASSGRFLLPYLPVFSLLVVVLLNGLKSRLLYKILFTVILIVSVSTIAYRGIASRRLINVIAGKENTAQFMLNNLEYQVGNFYDVDGFFVRNIKLEDKVLIYGISNLYYVNFPFFHESWIKKGDEFNYILAKDTALPQRFKNWILIYSNEKTRIKLYSFNNRMVKF